MLVDQQHGLPVKPLWTEAFGRNTDRMIAKTKSEEQRNQPKFLGGNPIEDGQVLLSEGVRCTLTCEAIARRNLAGREIAHQAQASDSTPGVASKIDYET